MTEIDPHRLSRNPHATIAPELDVNGRLAMRVTAAVRGRGLQVTTFDQQDMPQLFALMQALQDQRVDVKLSPELRGLLAQIGLLVRAGELPAAVEFRCPLPAPAGPPPDQRLCVSPWLEVLAGDAPRPAHFAPGPMLAVRDLRTGVRLPLWDDQHRLLTALQPGALAPALPSELCGRLIAAGVLSGGVGSEARPPANPSWGQVQVGFQRDGYAVLPRLMPVFVTSAMAAYYDQLVAQGFTRFGGDTVERRFTRHNEPVARYFLEQLAPLVGLLVGRPVKSTYVFFSRYVDGANLPRHVDRPQCEYSVSFQVDYRPRGRPAEPTGWPLLVGRPDSDEPDVALMLAPGDAVLYRGCDLAHGRPALPPGAESTHLFFHYVDARYGGPLD